MIKKSKKRKGIMLISLVLLLIVLSAVYYILTENTDTVSNEEKIIASQLDFKTIAQISYEYDNKRIDIVKEGDLWILRSDKNFPLNQKHVKSMIYATTNINAERVVDNSSENYERFRLDHPDISIWITDTNGDTITYLLSSYKKDFNQYYFSILGSDTVYLIEATLFNWFSKDINNLAEMDQFPQTKKEDVTGLTINSMGKRMDVDYIENSSNITYLDDSHWFLKKEGGDFWVTDTKRTEELIGNIRSISPASYADYEVSEEELPSYGLDTPLGTVLVKTTTPYSITIGNKDNSGLNYYVMHSESSILYLVRSEDIERILGITDVDLMPEQICKIDSKIINQIKIEYNNNTYVIKKDNGDAFLAFYESTTNLKRDGWTDEDTDTDSSKPYLSIIIYTNSDNYSELTLNFYQYNINFYRVEFDGIKNSLAGKRDVMNIIEKLNQFQQ